MLTALSLDLLTLEGRTYLVLAQVSFQNKLPVTLRISELFSFVCIMFVRT